jgi:DNA-binding protein YbaB
MNLREEFAAAVQRADAVIGRIRAAAQERAGARVRVQVAGGDVAVVVDGNARLLEIELARGAAGRHRHTLGAHVVEAVTTAQQQAIAEGRSVLAEFMSGRQPPGTPPGRGSPRAGRGDDDLETDAYFERVASDGFLR